jgi:hypothetical protein
MENYASPKEHHTNTVSELEKLKGLLNGVGRVAAPRGGLNFGNNAEAFSLIQVGSESGPKSHFVVEENDSEETLKSDGRLIAAIAY